IRNGSIVIVKNDRVDHARTDIWSPTSPARSVIGAREKHRSEANGAKIAQGRDRTCSGHRRLRRYAAHQLYGERVRDVVADVEHQRQVVADVSGRAGNRSTAGHDGRARMVECVEYADPRVPGTRLTSAFRSVIVLSERMRWRRNDRRRNDQPSDACPTHVLTSNISRSSAHRGESSMLRP